MPNFSSDKARFRIFLIQPHGTGSFTLPPLGLQIMATILSQNGYPQIVDVDENKGDREYGIDYTGDNVIVGMTVTFMTISTALKLSRHIKKCNPRALVIFGGPHITLCPEEAINDPSVDIVSIGEGHYTLLEICESLRTNSTLVDIKGIWFKDEKDQVLKNPPRDFLKNLDTLPLIDKRFFHEPTYIEYQHGTWRKYLAPIETTWMLMTAQSCPYDCHMCQPALRQIAGPWRQRSVGSVVGEINALREKYGAKKFFFYDNDMGVNRKWMLRFCGEVKKIPGCAFSCLGRANLLDYDLLAAMKEAGFNLIFFGAESGSDRVLHEIMNKRISVRQIVEAAGNCRKLGIEAFAYWMMANPGETIEEMKQTFHLASTLPVTYCHFHIATPNPGTRYHLEAIHGGYLNMQAWDDVNFRDRPTLLKDGITRQDIRNMDKMLIRIMLGKGWSYQFNGHTLIFANVKLLARTQPFRVIMRELRDFLHDGRLYHFRQLAVIASSWLGAGKTDGHA